MSAAPVISSRWATIADLLSFADTRLGHSIPPGAAVLDFGCGDGGDVALLLARGYDAWGVDVAVYPPSPAAVRLKTVDLSSYRLPFADDTFDFCFSEQVLEHVADHPTVFAEIARVLKPSGLSIHHFPGPNYPIEGHVGLPFPWLCRSRTYLAACARLGLRRASDQALNWRQQLEITERVIADVRYPSKRKLRRHAEVAGVEIEFVEREQLAFRSGGRVRRALDAARAVGLERTALWAASLVAQRCMVLRRKPGATPRPPSSARRGA